MSQATHNKAPSRPLNRCAVSRRLSLVDIKCGVHGCASCFCSSLHFARCAVRSFFSCSVSFRPLWNGFFPKRNGWRGQLSMGQSLTSFALSPEQSRHLALIALMGEVMGVSGIFISPQIFCTFLIEGPSDDQWTRGQTLPIQKIGA